MPGLESRSRLVYFNTIEQRVRRRSPIRQHAGRRDGDAASIDG
jgi:hypothetical protein